MVRVGAINFVCPAGGHATAILERRVEEGGTRLDNLRPNRPMDRVIDPPANSLAPFETCLGYKHINKLNVAALLVVWQDALLL